MAENKVVVGPKRKLALDQEGINTGQWLKCSFIKK
jgi:hypothetical protein